MARFQTLALSDIGISSITVAELEYGVCKSQQQEKNRALLNDGMNSPPNPPFWGTLGLSKSLTCGGFGGRFRNVATHRFILGFSNAKNRSALMQFLIPLEIVEFGQTAAIIYGSIRSDLESRGLVIGSMDMLIAAHALSLGVTLVSNNVREFSRIANLSLENWAE